MTADVEQTGTAVRSSRTRRGSTQSDRQIAFAVRDGKMVTVTISTGEKVTGYVFGVDDFHWLIITPHVETLMVHKSAPSVLIHQKSTLDAAHAEVQTLVSHFRSSVLRDYFKTTPSSRR